MEALTDEERKFGLYTGARCPRQKRDAIITLIAEGRAIDYIRRLVGVHRETVLNVANEFAAEIADYERRMPAKLKRTKWSLVDRIEREIDSIPRQALGLTLKIVSDIEAMDSGRASARVDHVHRIDLFSDFPAFIQELEAKPVMDEKKSAPAGIHLSGGKKLPLPASSADLEAIDSESTANPPGGPTSDWKSDVSGLPTQATQPILPTFAPDSTAAPTDSAAAVELQRDRDREGGGLIAGAPTNPAKDNGSQKFLANRL
jgi:hypothetical protein